MGQKSNPIGFRLAVNRNWSSPVCGTTAVRADAREDIKVRDFLKRKLAHASVGRALADRAAGEGCRITSSRRGRAW